MILFETDAGNVLVDTGMAPAGPVRISKKLMIYQYTVIYTHGHVDHAYGAWAIIGGETPEIIAHKNLRKDSLIRSLARVNSEIHEST